MRAFLLSLDTVLFLRLYSSLGSECVTADTDSFGLELLEALNSTIFMQTCVFFKLQGHRGSPDGLVFSVLKPPKPPFKSSQYTTTLS